MGQCTGRGLRRSSPSIITRASFPETSAGYFAQVIGPTSNCEYSMPIGGAAEVSEPLAWKLRIGWEGLHLYIGWVPVMLVVGGFVWAMRHRPRMGTYSGCSIVSIFGFASGWGWLPFMSAAPILAIIRNPSLAAGLAVPMILGLSALSADWLWV